jgi:hypothetical protein
MHSIDKLTFTDKCRIKWAIRNGWSAARVAIMLALPLEQVYETMDEFSGPEAPIS